MRRKALLLLSLLAVIALASTAAGARGSNPQIQAQKARQRSVLARVDQIGRETDKLNQEWDGAKIQLAKVDGQLQQNRIALHVARHNLKVAQARIMSRLYSLYVDGQPSAMDVLAGAKSLSDIIDRLESAQVLSSQDAQIGKQAVSFQLGVQQRERLLQRERAKRVEVVNRIFRAKQAAEDQLAQQRRLLASIGLSLHKLEEQARAQALRQRQLASERLAATLRQERQQQQEQLQQAQQAQQAQQSSGGSTGGVTNPPPVAIPTGGAGHPEAAQIALRYLGVPYVWGGASPSGFDCSGLVMYVYAQLGISLPHYTVAQWSVTQPISQSELEPGDLVFFNGLGHVGIYIGGGEFVDAPHTGSVVRIDSLSSFGGFDGARRVP